MCRPRRFVGTHQFWRLCVFDARRSVSPRVSGLLCSLSTLDLRLGGLGVMKSLERTMASKSAKMVAAAHLADYL